MSIQLSEWGPCSPIDPMDLKVVEACEADFNGDNQVDSADLGLLLSHYGESCN